MAYSHGNRLGDVPKPANALELIREIVAADGVDSIEDLVLDSVHGPGITGPSRRAGLGVRAGVASSGEELASLPSRRCQPEPATSICLSRSHAMTSSG
jgi:hypothetical protein